MRAAQLLEAIAYARRHLAAWAGLYLPELQRAAGLLAFTADTQCAPYRHLLDDARVRRCLPPAGLRKGGRRCCAAGQAGGRRSVLSHAPHSTLRSHLPPTHSPTHLPAQWLELGGLFLQELCRLNSLPPASLLSIHLQVGRLCGGGAGGRGWACVWLSSSAIVSGTRPRDGCGCATLERTPLSPPPSHPA